MKPANNVVNLIGLHSGSSDTNATDAGTTLPHIIKTARGLAIQKLDTLITKMFNNADDCLFDYAEKAENNQQQTLYFDSMRELRIRKNSIRAHFFDHFEQSFIQSYNIPEQLSTHMNVNSGKDAPLSLVKEDDLEELLAMTNMSQRIFSECREELSAMVIRFNEIAEWHKFSKELNPLAPELICNSFQSATACLTPIVEIKLIVFKLFDKYVIHNINQLYHDINNLFIDAGVLPTIKYNIVKNNSQTHSANITDKQPETYSDSHTPAQIDNYEAMRFALHEFQAGSTGNIGVGPNIPRANVAQYYLNHDVINGLSRLQCNPDFSNIDSVHNNQINSDTIKSSLVENIVHFRNDQQAKDISRNEADVVDIVSMMFDYILNDSQLPEKIKFSIGRLQIPMIKVAMLDKTFFSNKNHPARELLNELAITDGNLLSTSKQNITLFEKIEHIAQCIIEGFEQDTAIFEDLLLEFREFIESYQQADKLSKQILLRARKTVASELQRRLRQGNIPVEIRQFLLGPWKEVLHFVAIKDNAEGDTWYLFTSFIDNLLWSITPKYNAEERVQLTQQIPVLLLVINEGIKHINKHQLDVEKFTKNLEQLHLVALRTNLSETADESDSNANAEPIEETTEDVTAESSPTQFNSYRRDLSDPNINTSTHFDLVNRLAINTWVEFIDQSISRKGKLTWKSRFTGDYVFMSSTHKIVADLNMRELIQLFEEGSAHIIDNVPVLDKAIDSIMNTLHNYTTHKKKTRPILH